MRALCWHGKSDVRVDTVADPKFLHPRGAIIKITACAICGSDLHLLDGYQPAMEKSDILGHENMGEAIEAGSEVTNLKPGDRVVQRRVSNCQRFGSGKREYLGGGHRKNIASGFGIRDIAFSYGAGKERLDLQQVDMQFNFRLV